MTETSILVVDDEESIRWIFQKSLQKRGYRVVTAAGGNEALRLVEEDTFSTIFLDIRLPDLDGLTVLDRLQEMWPQIPVIVMTAQNTMVNAINAMKKGAYDYIVKPFDLPEVYALVEKTIQSQGSSAFTPVAQTLPEDFSQSGVIGQSEKMREIYKLIGKIASRNVTILLRGESGTGKELLARTIHAHSRRADSPFVVVNCGAIPRELLESELFGHEKGAFTGAHIAKPGKFELADKGTLLLDEIGDLEPILQVKLLRALQEKEFYRVGGKEPIRVDVRVIAATHRDLEQAIAQGQFREDLFYRLNVVPIVVPPLRERREDIPLLLQYFLQKFAQELELEPKHFSEQTLHLLQLYDWPGNVRELENVVKRSMLLCSGRLITPDYLPESISGIHPQAENPADYSLEALLRQRIQAALSQKMKEGNLYQTILEDIERPLFRAVLAETGGNQLRAADLLGLNRNTLRKKLRSLGLKGKEKEHTT